MKEDEKKQPESSHESPIIDDNKLHELEVDEIAQILKDNITFSPQVGTYVIHGAIEKIINWADKRAKITVQEKIRMIAYNKNLYEHIKHGKEAHRQWLYREMHMFLEKYLFMPEEYEQEQKLEQSNKKERREAEEIIAHELECLKAFNL